ncbi:MAG: hypothetical protein MUF34_08375 [Polyangiaceae bacterium]|jgi:hypothetical protein|nr:hypothetical protein [Polyangiaceae bacterium]
MSVAGDPPSELPASAPPPTALPTWGEVLASPVLLTGLYVWGVSVAPAALVAASLNRGRPGVGFSPSITVLASFGSLACLGVGAWLERRRSPNAPFVGVWGFLGLATCGWLATPAAVDVARLEALRGWLVGAGLVLYALAWGAPHPSPRRGADEGRSEPTAWAPRERLAPGAPLLLGLGIVTSMGVGALAWGVHDPFRSTAAHALAGLVGVTFVSNVARLSVERGRPLGRSNRRALLGRAAWALAWVALAVGGLLFAVLR